MKRFTFWDFLALDFLVNRSVKSALREADPERYKPDAYDNAWDFMDRITYKVFGVLGYLIGFALFCWVSVSILGAIWSLVFTHVVAPLIPQPTPSTPIVAAQVQTPVPTSALSPASSDTSHQPAGFDWVAWQQKNQLHDYSSPTPKAKLVRLPKHFAGPAWDRQLN